MHPIPSLEEGRKGEGSEEGSISMTVTATHGKSGAWIARKASMVMIGAMQSVLGGRHCGD